MLPIDFQAAKPNAQLRRGMKLEQFSQGDPLDGTERPAVVIVKKLLSFLGAKALNYTHGILRHTLYAKQWMPTIGLPRASGRVEALLDSGSRSTPAAPSAAESAYFE